MLCLVLNCSEMLFSRLMMWVMVLCLFFAEGFMSWMWKGISFLLPFLFAGYVSLCSRFLVCPKSHPKCSITIIKSNPKCSMTIIKSHQNVPWQLSKVTKMFHDNYPAQTQSLSPVQIPVLFKLMSFLIFKLFLKKHDIMIKLENV